MRILKTISVLSGGPRISELGNGTQDDGDKPAQWWHSWHSQRSSCVRSGDIWKTNTWLPPFLLQGLAYGVWFREKITLGGRAHVGCFNFIYHLTMHCSTLDFVRTGQRICSFGTTRRRQPNESIETISTNCIRLNTFLRSLLCACVRTIFKAPKINHFQSPEN